MRTLSILLLSTLLSTVTSQCEPCDITPNGFTVRPGTGCLEYISCVDGAEANVQSCQGGTIFDLAIGEFIAAIYVVHCVDLLM